MAFDITLAILFVGFSGILAYLAATTELDSEYPAVTIINGAMRLIFFAGCLGFMLIGLNFGTLMAEDACIASGITESPVIAYKTMIWIFVFVMFCILITIIYNITMGMQLKKKAEEER